MVIIMIIIGILTGIAATRWKDPINVRTQGAAQILKEFLLRGPDRARSSPWGVTLIIRNPNAFPNDPTVAFQEHLDENGTLQAANFTEALRIADQGLVLSSSIGTPNSLGTTQIDFHTTGVISDSTPLAISPSPVLIDISAVDGIPLHRIVMQGSSGTPSIKVCESVAGVSTTNICPGAASGWCDSEDISKDCP